MDKRLGFFLVAFVLIASALPLSVQAEPTRALGAEIDELFIDGPTAEGGEYAAGSHMVSIMLNNTGDQDYGEFIDFFVNVTYTSNGSVHHYEVLIDRPQFIPVGSRSKSDLLEIDLPEGQFDIKVNATISLVETQQMITVDVMDVVDLSIVNVGFEEGESYDLNVEMFPICNVSFAGNVDNFADNVNINLLIETDDVVSDTVYDESMEILTPASPAVSPGKYWIASFPGWTPNSSGPYEATFSVYYDTYDEANNEDLVTFEVANPPVIEGTVTSEGSPLPGVEVIVSTSPETSTMTDVDGKYFFYDIPAGNYSIEFTKMWASGNVTAVTVVPGETQMVDVSLAMLEVGGLRGNVKLPDNSPAAGTWITVSADDFADITTSTNSTGYFEIEEVSAGNITITASFSGYEDDTVNMNIAQGTWNTMDLQLGDIPFAVNFSVPNGELVFPVFDSISVFFTRPIDRTSVDSTTLILKKLSTGDVISVIYSFADSDMTVVITPDPPLSYGTEYQIEVTSWVQDTNGDFFPAPVYSTFNTELDIQEVELISFFPLDDANEVPIDVTIFIVFPVAMDEDTINGDNIEMTERGGRIVNSVITYDPLTKRAYLDPVEDLDYGTRYSISLDPDIAPMEPSFDFLGFYWSFETEVLITTGSLVGKVLNEEGIPFSPSQVTIKLSTGVNNVLTKTPNLAGEFEFIDVEEGVWTLSIMVNGYDEYTKDFTINSGETTELPEDINLPKSVSSEADDEPPWAIIILIAIVVLVIIVIIYYLLNRPKEEEEEEEGHQHRPRFGGRRQDPAYYGDYDEMGEGEFMCPVCGNVVEGEDAICPICGSEFEDDLFECPECGAGIPSDAISCPECDAVFEDEEGSEDDEGYYEEDEEEVDITEDYEVEDLSDEDFGIAEIE